MRKLFYASVGATGLVLQGAKRQLQSRNPLCPMAAAANARSSLQQVHERQVRGSVAIGRVTRRLVQQSAAA